MKSDNLVTPIGKSIIAVFRGYLQASLLLGSCQLSVYLFCLPAVTHPGHICPRGIVIAVRQYTQFNDNFVVFQIVQYLINYSLGM